MLVGSTIGPFDIEKEIGSGAMGTVYRAKFRKGEEKTVVVALKVVSLGLLGNESAMARFEREAHILKQLRHPNIVRLLATGRYRQTPFIAMEFIDGESLDAVLARRVRFSWEEVVSYGKQLCQALQHAHDKGIIHRDLKPSNLMLTKEGVLKLTDFGIAKDTDVTALTGANSTIGTASYMSPEQCKGDRNLTPKSDLYSLGIVFFELLTGKKPFNADSTVDMFLKHVNEKPPRAGRIVSELPGKLDALIMQLVEKDKDNRPVDASWVARMLTEVEEDAFARQSVGLDVASGKRINREAALEKGIDDADRDAARALKGKKKKKSRKEAVVAVPWFQRTPVKAAGIVAVLLGIATGLYFAFKPAGPTDLYAAVEKAGDDDAVLAASDKYLAAYGGLGDDQTKTVQEKARAVRVKKREEVLTRRFSKGMAKPDDKDDPEAYSTAWLALEAEKAGDTKRASDLWEAVRRKFPNAEAMREPLTDDERIKALWSWVAVKRITDIKTASDRGPQLTTQIQQEWIKETFTTYGPVEPRGLAVRAMRLELFGDKPKARATWDSLATQTEPRADQHEWYLLAAQRRRMIPEVKEDVALNERVARVAKALEDARKAAATPSSEAHYAVEMRKARNGCRDILDLYDGDPDERLRNLVTEARRLFDSLPKPG